MQSNHFVLNKQNIPHKVISEYFFYIDSNGLDSVETKLYGYTQVPQDKLNKYLLDKHAYEYVTEGAFVLIQSFEDEILITQDYMGSYGLYLYREENFFAISNSLLYLVQKLSTQRHISLNKDFLNHFLLVELTPLSYSETIVKEVSIIPRHSRVKIDRKSGLVSVHDIKYEIFSVDIDSEVALNLLDKWHNKWSEIIKNQIQSEKNVAVDLSGGFDSRLVFSLFTDKDIDLNKVNVHSNTRTVHTYTEDYLIAKDISKFYDFKLNNQSKNLENFSMPIEYSFNLSAYTKMFSHKEMQYQRSFNKDIVYHYGGLGGESIRHHWGYDVESYINKYHEKQKSIGLINHYHKSFKKIVNRSFDEVRCKYNYHLDDSFLVGKLFYIETRARYHFGRDMVLNFFSNRVRLAPLLDPIIQQIRLPKSDHNLLMALIFVRYSKDLLSFKFDSNKFIGRSSIERAEEINRKFPVNNNTFKRNKYSIVVQELSNNIYESCAQNLSEYNFKTPNHLIHQLYLSKPLTEFFESFGYEDYYRYANDYAHNRDYEPFSEINALFSLYVINNIIESDRVFENPYRLLEKLYEDELLNASNICGYYLNDRVGVSAGLVYYKLRLNRLIHLLLGVRIDIKNINNLIDGSDCVIDVTDVDGTLNIANNPKWFSDKSGIGHIIQTKGTKINVLITAKNVGNLEVKIRAVDKKINNKQLGQLVDLVSFKIDGVDMLDSHISVSHDVPFKWFTAVEKNQKIQLEILWKIHDYSYDELIDLLNSL